MKYNFFKILLFISLFASCEKDITGFDSEVINSDNAINFSTNSIEYGLTTRSQMVNPVQTNNLPSFLLGSYDHPQYGRSIQALLVKWCQLNTIMILEIMLFLTPLFNNSVLFKRS